MRKLMFLIVKRTKITLTLTLTIDNSNSVMQLTNIRLKDIINRVIIGNLNINSLPFKFAQLQEMVLKYVDILF